MGLFGEVLKKVAGPLVGGILGGVGQSSANRSNERIARENREFQERMSNTAYQRAAKDMSSAGLNRILAVGSPATTPGGSTATFGNVGAAAVQGASAGGSTARAERAFDQEMKLMNAQSWNQMGQADQWFDVRKRLQAEVKEINQRTRVHSASARIREGEADFYDATMNEMPGLLKTIPGMSAAAQALEKVNELRKRGKGK